MYIAREFPGRCPGLVCYALSGLEYKPGIRNLAANQWTISPPQQKWGEDVRSFSSVQGDHTRSSQLNIRAGANHCHNTVEDDAAQEDANHQLDNIAGGPAVVLVRE